MAEMTDAAGDAVELADHVVVFSTDVGPAGVVGPVTRDEGVAYVTAHPEVWADGVYWQVLPIHPPTASGYEVLPGEPDA